MIIGVPIVGVATTELPTVVRNGESDYIDTNLSALIKRKSSAALNRCLGGSRSKTVALSVAALYEEVLTSTIRYQPSLLREVRHHAYVPAWGAGSLS